MDVDFSYSIIPLPKYDTDQEKYQTFSQDMYSVIGVMDCIGEERSERVSAVLELMCAKSYSDIRPYYIEDVLKTRYSDDVTSIKIFNLVMDGLIFDTAWLHAASIMEGEGASARIYGIDIWRGCFYGDRAGSTPETVWAKGQVAFITKTAELNMWFKQQAEKAG